MHRRWRSERTWRSGLRVIALGMLASASTTCRCTEHPLYDAKNNRFDTWYLGGGNTQYRPFRRGEAPPDALFDVETVLDADHRGQPRMRAWILDAVDPQAVSGELRAGEHVLGAFRPGTTNELELVIPRATALAAAQRGDLKAVFRDPVGASIEVVIEASDLNDALAALGVHALEEP